MDGFGIEQLAAALQPWRQAPRLWIAYSGGLDSTVLLHAARALRLPVYALHVDHGLHPDSCQWARHCRIQCAAVGVPLRVERVTVHPRGDGLEAAARAARYQAYATVLGPRECIATAHHADDQAETVLLRILRGTGIDGLAGMPIERALGAGCLIRPLLGFRRADLAAYANCHELCWLDDPANRSDQHDRSFLRQRVVPLLEPRWPGLERRLARLARHAGVATALAECRAREHLARLGDTRSLGVAAVAELEPALRLQLLRTWVRQQDRRPPPERRLQQGLADLLSAARDRHPALAWSDGCIRRYRDRLYFLPPELPQAPVDPLPWDMARPLCVPALGRLEIRPGVGRGIRAQCLQQAPVEVRFRRGGERLRIGGYAQPRALKRVLQERGIPPWVRQRLPLVFIGHDLAAVADLLIADPFVAGPAEAGLELHWHRAGTSAQEDSAL
ncbi:MAG TPA: tRNA lysidine(34) synthetase TilS [Nitrococcus sp.]|nr:tRNA lysidine(34) synthetase TilS [Nitrococcus sp.]